MHNTAMVAIAYAGLVFGLALLLLPEWWAHKLNTWFNLPHPPDCGCKGKP